MLQMNVDCECEAVSHSIARLRPCSNPDFIGAYTYMYMYTYRNYIVLMSVNQVTRTYTCVHGVLCCFALSFF